MSTIAVVGLGYVGLPLAVAFGRLKKTIGFDLSAEKIRHYKQHHDPSGEVSSQELQAAVHLTCTTDPSLLAEADCIIVAVPTPVDAAHQPDFSPLVNASRMIGQYMKRGALIIYESTVYPGATEEVCIPILEEASGYKWLADFNVGYSPERINPGDKEHSLRNTVKVVAGDTAQTLDKV
ncbi:MAG: nucleotide sugar dehydrogenase, partial [Methylophilaceae bacterium]